MKSILALVLALSLFSCSNSSELDKVVEKAPSLKNLVDSLKSTSLIYTRCEECNLSGLQGNKLIGFTDRYPPKGEYYKKEINIGAFEYDTYLISKSDNNERISGKMYVCYFDRVQKEKLKNFERFYVNRIRHHKQLCQIQYFKNAVIINIENGDF